MLGFGSQMIKFRALGEMFGLLCMLKVFCAPELYRCLGLFGLGALLLVRLRATCFGAVVFRIFSVRALEFELVGLSILISVVGLSVGSYDVQARSCFGVSCSAMFMGFSSFELCLEHLFSPLGLDT